ncbi:MAG: outer membrane protein assembly factor BamE domain-containing protein [Stenotrophobium sp.]
MNTLHLRKLLLGLCLLFTACSPSKATQANYDKVSPLMTRDQVDALLGKPDGVNTVGGDDSSALVTETWHAESRTITVTFSNGQMIFKDMHNKI